MSIPIELDPCQTAAVRATALEEGAAAPAGRLKWKRILVPVDFSPESMRALQLAGSLAGTFGARLFLVRVVERASFLAGMDEVPLALSEEQVVQQETIELTRWARQEVPGAIAAETHLRRGSVPGAVSALARELDIDLVVICSRGFSGVKRWWFRSVADQVARQAPCPVLVLRAPAGEGPAPQPP